MVVGKFGNRECRDGGVGDRDVLARGPGVQGWMEREL